MPIYRRVFFVVLICILQAFSFSSLAFSYDDSGTLTVSGTVPPKADAYIATIDADRPYTVSQDTLVTYTISYTSNDGSSTPLIVQAQWYKGKIDGASDSSVELLTYETGTATNAYGGTTPTIDLNNRTITWSISSLPPGLGSQTVSFGLKTTDTYSGSKIVTFPVAARIISPVTTVDQTIQRVYQYASSTSASDSITSSSSTVSSSPSSTASGQGPSIQISRLSVRNISAHEAEVAFLTSEPTTAKIIYGTNPKLLNKTLQEAQASTRHINKFLSLEKSKRYYFKIQLGSVGPPRAELYTFQTASAEILPETPLLLSANQPWGISFIYGTDSNNPGDPILIATSDSLLNLQFRIPNNLHIQTVTVFTQPVQVLGITTENDDYQSRIADAIELDNGIYMVRLRLPKEAGSYDILTRYEDIYGNVTEKKLATTRIILPFRIFDENNAPLAGVSIRIARLNTKQKIYEDLPSTIAAVHNPTSSDSDGIVSLALLPGRYKATITSQGYDSQEVEYDIQAIDQQDLPQVTLIREPLSINFVMRDASAMVGKYWENNQSMVFLIVLTLINIGLLLRNVVLLRRLH